MGQMVRFIGTFRIPGGPIYVPGDHALLDERLAAQAVAQGVAVTEDDASGQRAAAPTGPDAHKMVTHGRRKAR